jgi:hypothetical protein
LSQSNQSNEYQDIIRRLSEIERAVGVNDKAPAKIPLIDPTANVLALVAAETKRQDDLRTLAEKFQDKIDVERTRTDSDAKRAEADRIDALLAANKNDVALALAKQQAQAEAQDKRIAIVEQNQYQGVGGKEQRTESQHRSEWLIGLIVVIAGALGGMLVHLLGK